MWGFKETKDLKCPYLKCPFCNQTEIPQGNIDKYKSDFRFAPFHLGCIVNKIKELEKEIKKIKKNK